MIRITAFWGSLRDHSDSNHCVLGNSDSNHDTQYTEEPRTAKKPGGPRCLCFFVLSFFFFLLILGFPEGEAVIRITAFWGSLRDHSDSNHCVLGNSDSNHEPNTLKSPEQPKNQGGQGVCVSLFFPFFFGC